LDAATGAELWRFTALYYVHSSPAVANGVVYVGESWLHIYALDAATGAKLWSYDTGDFVESSPAVADGAVYVGSEERRIYAFRLPASLSHSSHQSVDLAGPHLARAAMQQNGQR
jgi:outer membrane protein assembly factor BamB